MPALRPILERSKRQETADPPVLELRPVGEGRAFCHALARIIVRRELILAGMIPDPDGCKISPTQDNTHIGVAEGARNGGSDVLPPVKE